MAKDNKTSKTARVMNLLSKKADPTPGESTVEAPAPAPPVPPIVTSMAPDAAVSVQIKNALEDALESELGPQQPAPAQAAPPVEEAAPVQAAAPAVETAPVQAAAPAVETAPVQAAAPVVEPAPVQAAPPAVEAAPVQAVAPVVESAPVQAAAPAVETAPVQAAPPVEETAPPSPVLEGPAIWKQPIKPIDPGYINVMQVLVEEKAPKYIKMFGLCQCARCLEDVKALTLNHLPSKYVVLEQGDLIPRLTVYEGQFSSDVTAQLLQACKLVMERPHHGR